MIAVDTNILVYAHRKDVDFHDQANACIKELAEDARIVVRGASRDANDMLKAVETAKDISEDESKAGQNSIQELTDKHIAMVDKVGEKNEKGTWKCSDARGSLT